ncbi:rhodanese-like domain-containing protein [Lacihabitans sp. LS3-19]|uniref:rhodanese-like domain-containing protein n=1 Tax=Lacihabitans sp. LS3-19 TaxID=2487335 RepID=UPI0020CCBD9E|nr:rhodanese-like domain-containing protein [Lacihabitans sp. LS3-19]MCP9766878.1 rhodanese-like domain-containing protein [Lacihabitans sp. LS3-19]
MNENFDITVAQLKEMIESGEKFNLIDVRNPDEYEEDNIGGILIPLGDLPDSLDQLETMKGQDIYVHCRSGARSERAKQYLLAEGFEKVHNVLGGIMAYRS